MTVPTRYHNRDEARARFGAFADRYGALLLEGDPVADAACRSLAARPDGHELLDRVLADGTAEAPDAVRALFAELDAVPAWVDRARLDHGARVYQRMGPGAAVLLHCLSLLRGYHSAAVTRVLAAAGPLETTARGRLGETGYFIHLVTQVGGLARHAPGFAASVRVRLMHARVRTLLMDSGRWDPERLGVPINQADLAATGLAFSIAVILGARELGYHLDPKEAADVLHLWRYVSHLMGLDPSLQWTDEEEALALAELVDLTQPGAGDDSRRLAEALRHAYGRRARGPRRWRPLEKVQLAYLDQVSRALNGDPMSDDLGLPRARRLRFGHPSLLVTRAVVRPAELVRRSVPGADRVARQVGNRIFHRLVRNLLDGHEPTFRWPASLGGMGGQGSLSGCPLPHSPPRDGGVIYDYRRRATSG